MALVVGRTGWHPVGSGITVESPPLAITWVGASLSISLERLGKIIRGPGATDNSQTSASSDQLIQHFTKRRQRGSRH